MAAELLQAVFHILSKYILRMAIIYMGSVGTLLDVNGLIMFSSI